MSLPNRTGRGSWMRPRPKGLEFLEVLCGALRSDGARDPRDRRDLVWQLLAKDGALEEGGNRDPGQWIVRALRALLREGDYRTGEAMDFRAASIAVATLKLNRAIEKTPVDCS